MGLAASLLYIVRPDFRLFLLAEIVFAVAYTLHSGADEALAYDSLLAHDQAASSKRVLARMEACKLGGIITGTLTDGFIAATWGLRAPMIAYVAPAALAFLLALTLKEPPVSRPAETRKSYRATLIDGGRYFLQHKILLLLAVDMAITNAFAWGIIWLFQPLLARRRRCRWWCWASWSRSRSSDPRADLQLVPQQVHSIGQARHRAVHDLHAADARDRDHEPAHRLLCRALAELDAARARRCPGGVSGVLAGRGEAPAGMIR